MSRNRVPIHQLQLSNTLAAETCCGWSHCSKANCYDNAVIEAFWSTLKLELVYRTNFTTTAQAHAALFDYIEVFYNRRRRHSALGYQSPAEFEASNN